VASLKLCVLINSSKLSTFSGELHKELFANLCVCHFSTAETNSNFKTVTFFKELLAVLKLNIEVVKADAWGHTDFFDLNNVLVALCFLFPAVSTMVIIPYINNVFENATEVISSDNIIIMMIMLFAIFAIPAAAWLSARHTKYRKVTRYINGVNAGDQMNYIDSFGEKRRFFLANWYMEDIFGEKRIWNPSLIISSVCIVVLLVITIGGAVK